MSLIRRIKEKFHADDPVQLKRELRWLAGCMKRHWGKILAIGILGLLGTAMGLVSNVAVKYLIDAVTGLRLQLLIRSGVIMAVMMLGGLVFQGRQEIDGSVSHCIHIKIQPVQQVAAAVRLQRLPAGPQDPGISLVLHLIADADMNGRTHTGRHALKYKAAQHHNTHDHGTTLQKIRTAACNRIDQILGRHTGSQTHGSTHQAQQADQQNAAFIAVHSCRQPEQFPLQLLRIISMEFFLQFLNQMHLPNLTIRRFNFRPVRIKSRDFGYKTPE